MNEVTTNSKIQLSQHFQLGEFTKSNESKQDYDELFIEKNKYGRYWVHFAVRPQENRRKIGFLNG